MEATPSTAGILGLVRQLQRRLGGDGLGTVFMGDAARTMVFSVVGAAISMLVQILVARLVGHDSYGAYQYALAWMNAALLFGKLEIDNIGVRFVAAYSATSRWGMLRGFLRDAHGAIVVASLLVALVGAGAVLVWRPWLTLEHPQLPLTMWLACALVPVTALLFVQSAVLQGFQRYVSAQVGPNILRPLVLGVGVVGVWLVLRQPLTPAATMAANILASLGALIFVEGIVRRARPPALDAVAHEHDRADWMRTTRPLFIVAVAQLIISPQIGSLVVGTLVSTADSGTYSAASQLSIPLGIAVNAVTFVAQPMIADIYARGDTIGLQRLIGAVTRANLAVAIPLSLLLIAGGKFFLGLYGPEFVAGYDVLVVLTVTQLVVALGGGVAGYLLTMTRHQTEAAWIIGLSAVLNLVLTFMWTPRYGPLGTALAALVSSVARSIILTVYIRRAMKLTVPSL